MDKRARISVIPTPIWDEDYALPHRQEYESPGDGHDTPSAVFVRSTESNNKPSLFGHATRKRPGTPSTTVSHGTSTSTFPTKTASSMSSFCGSIASDSNPTKDKDSSGHDASSRRGTPEPWFGATGRSMNHYLQGMSSYRDSDNELLSSTYKQQLHINPVEERPSDDETSSMEDSDEDDSNAGWSGEVDRIESAVLDHVADPGLATYLIEKLYHEFIQQKAKTINGWQVVTNQCQGMEGSSGKGKSPENTGSRGLGNPLKRRRPSDEYNSEDGANEEGDGDGDGHRPPEMRGSGPGEISRMFACPLFKLDPDLHCRGVNGELFMTCQRGFKSLQRLREHLKRTHSPVQCDRCYQIFHSKPYDREKCLVELREHRQQAEPCEKETPRQQYGISDEQWAALDKLGRNRKKTAVPASMKWMEMWDVISRGQPRPTSAYVEETRILRTRPEGEAFTRTFTDLANLAIRTGILPTDIDNSVVQILLALGRYSFDVTCTKNALPASMDGTSSINTRRPSDLESPITPSRDENDQGQVATQLQTALASLQQQQQQPIKSNPAPAAHLGFDVNQLSPDSILNATCAAPSPVVDDDFHMDTLQMGIGDQFDPDFSWLPGPGQPDEFNLLNGFSQ